jgi:hypothetical protein
LLFGLAHLIQRGMSRQWGAHEIGK